MMQKTYISTLLVVFLLLFYTAKAQVDPVKTEQEIEEKIENIVESSDENADIDYSSLFDQLSVYEDNPIDINTAGEEQLQNLIFLDEFQIIQLLDYRKRYGRIVSIYELQGIEGFDYATIQKILPYITLGKESTFPKISLKEVFSRGKNSLMMRYQQVLQEQKGFSPASDSLLQAKPNSRYLGSPYRLMAKYKFTYKNKIQWGLTGEKDPGEEFFKGTQKQGFDFYSAHFFLRDFGPLKKLAIGDFEAKFGQGLVLFSGLGFGKSANIGQAKKFAQGIKPFSSTDENNFFRGAAFTVGNRKVEGSLLFSSKYVDGNVTKYDSLDSEVLQISSLQTSGYHTTVNEVNDKHSVKETVYGGNVALKGNWYKVGITGVAVNYSVPIVKKSYLYNKFDFTGQKNTTVGVDYQGFWKSVTFFGEVARSENGGMAYLNSALFNVDSKFAFLILNRYFEKDFQSLYSNAFSESSRAINENGTYYGIEFYPYPKWTLTAFYDIYRFDWLRFGTDAPSDGSDYNIELKYNPSRNVEMQWRFRDKTKGENLTGEPMNTLTYYHRTNFRYHISYKLTSTLTLKNRIEYTRYQDKTVSEGYLFYQDVSYSPESGKYTINARYALFDCDSYDARIYAYESDVLHAFSIPGYYGRGSRFYIMLKYKIIKNVDVWLRYAQYLYNDRDVISSGLNEIQGNLKSEIKAQLRVKF